MEAASDPESSRKLQEGSALRVRRLCQPLAISQRPAGPQVVPGSRASLISILRGTGSSTARPEQKLRSVRNEERPQAALFPSGCGVLSPELYSRVESPCVLFLPPCAQPSHPAPGQQANPCRTPVPTNWEKAAMGQTVVCLGSGEGECLRQSLYYMNSSLCFQGYKHL